MPGKQRNTRMTAPNNRSELLLGLKTAQGDRHLQGGETDQKNPAQKHQLPPAVRHQQHSSTDHQGPKKHKWNLQLDSIEIFPECSLTQVYEANVTTTMKQPAFRPNHFKFLYP